MKQVESVLGPISSADLGLTLTHEHLLNDVLSWWHPPLDESPRSRELVDEKVSITNIWELKHDPFVNKDNCSMQDIELAIKEVQRFVDQGGKTIIETSADGNGRSPEGLATISKRTGLNIIKVVLKPGATLVASVGGDPLIATTQVGKGRSLVWTSDIGPHWCPEPFVQWNGFAPLMSNMIDWVTGK